MTGATRHNHPVTHAARVVLLIVTSLLGAACQPKPPVVDLAAVEAAVKQRTIDWAHAEASNNVDSAMSFVWEDATMQPPNSPEIQGHETIRALYKSVTFVSVEPGAMKAQVGAGGDLAATWGTLAVVLKGPTGPITDNGKFVIVWQRRDGQWKVLENSWSSNAPPPPAR